MSFLDTNQDGEMSIPEVKVLIAKMTGTGVADIPDDHPELRMLAGISTDELSNRLCAMMDPDTIDMYHSKLGLEMVQMVGLK